MNAVGFYKTGGPEVLERLEVGDPLPSANEITIRISRTSVNRLDVLMRSGATRISMKMPHITGSDIVGTVERVGEGVGDFAPGERVVANAVTSCGACVHCRNGNEVYCKDWKVPGLQVWGSYGELARMPASSVLRPPLSFSDEELGCLPLSLTVSWRALRTQLQAKEGESIVIRAASGSVGILSVMIAKAMGLDVIALTRSDKKEDELKAIGAGSVVACNNEEEVFKRVMELTEDRGADIVLDSTGSTLNDSIALLRDGGRVAVFGTLGGLSSSIAIKKFYWKNASIFGVHSANRAEFADALEFARRKGLRPIIVKRMKVSEAAEAHRIFEESRIFGKIVLEHRW